MKTIRLIALFVSAFIVAPCTWAQKAVPKTGLDSISAADFAAAVKILSSDDFEGRGVATPGEAKTIAFLQAEFKRAGALPGNGASYLQAVPMVKIANDHQGTLTLTGNAGPLTLAYGPDFIGVSRQSREAIAGTDSALVFVGFGIVAPEYNWDDYRGLDVRGKTVVIFVNDPGYYDATLFRGKNMTYYGRWIYKFEEAGRHGAAAALLIHDSGPASYGWAVVKNSWSGARFQLDSGNDDQKCALDAWISQESAQKISAAAGADLQKWLKAACTPGFKPIPLALSAAFTVRNTVEKVVSHNVLAKLPGSDLASECIVYTAHWDHFGKDPALKGDQIYNGALDNATGTAALIELAKAFKSVGVPLRRSVLLIAVTGEEQMLLGSDFYAHHPVIPLAKTVANINMDSLNIFGRMKDIEASGYGWSELDDYLRAAAAAQDRIVLPDSHPESGGFFRSDHFSFVKLGVPAVNATAGEQHREKGAEWGHKQKNEYIARNYHKPSDEYSADWDLSGAVEDIQLFFTIGYRLKQNCCPSSIDKCIYIS